MTLLSNRPREGVHTPVQSLELCPDRGILGDRWSETAWLKLPDGSPDPRVQVSVTNIGIMEFLTGSVERVRDCGDNLFVDLDLSMTNLPDGARLQAGEAIIEVSDVYNDACGKFAQRFGPVAFQWIRLPDNRPLRLRGLFARIIQGGIINAGDPIVRL